MPPGLRPLPKCPSRSEARPQAPRRPSGPCAAPRGRSRPCRPWVAQVRVRCPAPGRGLRYRRQRLPTPRPFSANSEMTACSAAPPGGVSTLRDGGHRRDLGYLGLRPQAEATPGPVSGPPPVTVTRLGRAARVTCPSAPAMGPLAGRAGAGSRGAQRSPRCNRSGTTRS